MRGGANHSPTSSVLVKNGWNYTSTLPHNFMPCYGTPLPVYGTGLAIIYYLLNTYYKVLLCGTRYT